MAFAVAPAASTFTIVVVLSVIGRSLPSLGYVFIVASLAYGTGCVIGIPAFLVSRPWRLHSISFYASTALIISLPFLVISAILTRGIELPLVASLGAVIGGVAFYGVMEGSER
jgi:hypothetical protein